MEDNISGDEDNENEDETGKYSIEMDWKQYFS